MTKMIILQYTRLYIGRLKAKIQFGQWLWDDDSWFFCKGGETILSISCIFQRAEKFRGEEVHLLIGDDENMWATTLLNV